jgi:hypothetical protein
VSPRRTNPVYTAAFGAAVRWLATNLDECHTLEVEGRLDPDKLRSLAEIGLLCGTYHRRFGALHGTWLRKCEAHLWKTFNDPAYRQWVLRQPGLLVLFANHYVAMRDCRRRPDPAFKGMLQLVVDQGYATAIEQPYTAMMGLRYILDRAAVRHNLPPAAALYRGTLLRRSPPPVFLSQTDLYIVTHTAFYVTDYGFRPAFVLSPRQRAAALDFVSAALQLVLEQKNWDACSELLLARECLRAPRDPPSPQAWKALLSVQDEDGSFRTPKSSYMVHPVSTFHTTLVAAIALSLSR